MKGNAHTMSSRADRPEEKLAVDAGDLTRLFAAEFGEHARVLERSRESLSTGFCALVEACVAGLASGGKLLLFGNGGSAADAQHIAAELTVRYARDRTAIPALALTTDTSALTAAGNDLGFERIFSRQIEALGRRGDVAIGLSTSGRSPNVLAALRTARERGLRTAALAGGDGGELPDLTDVCLIVPSTSIARIQEMHILIGHSLCEALEGAVGTSREHVTAAGKLGSLSTVADRVTAWRNQGARIGFTNGCFDVIHPGHVSLLEQAARACDRLVVGLNSDASVRRLKGADRPIHAQAARATVLASIGVVDAVVQFDEDTPLRVIEALRPDVLIKGADYREEQVVGAAFVKSCGGEVLLARLEPDAGTTKTIDAIRARGG